MTVVREDAVAVKQEEEEQQKNTNCEGEVVISCSLPLMPSLESLFACKMRPMSVYRRPLTRLWLV